MTKTFTQVAAFALSALITAGIVAGMNGIATHEYIAADTLALAAAGPVDATVQQVIVIGHRANA